MRILITILLLIIHGACLGQIAGAAGNGTTDDTAAIQAWLDTPSGTPVGTETYRITSLLSVDQSGDQTFDFNGAAITVTSEISQLFDINKPSGRATFTDLEVDGNSFLEWAFYVRSQTTFNNVDIHHIYSNDTRAVGWRIEVSSTAASQGTYTFTDCDCTDIESAGNNQIGDIIGTSRCLWVRWLDTDSATTVTVNNAVWDGVWGDDGDIIQVEQTTNDYIHNCELIINNSDLKNFSRRIIKGTASNVQANNTVFTSPAASNPRLTSTVPPSGMVTLATFNITSFPNSNSRLNEFIDCTFNGTSYENRIIPARTELFTFEGNTFNDASIALNVRVGDGTITNNTFTGSSTFGGPIYTYGGTDMVGTITIDNNTATQESGSGTGWLAFIDLDDANGIIDNLNITDNLIFTDDDGPDTVYGLLWIGSQISTPTTDLFVNNNVVVRQGSSEGSDAILRIDDAISGTNTFTNNILMNAAGTSADLIDLNGSASGVTESGNSAQLLSYDYSSLGVGATGEGTGDTTPPTASNVTVSEVTDTSFRVSWNLNEGATGQLEYGLSSSYGSTTTFEPNYLTFHSQVISGLSAGLLYYFNITGADISGNEIVEVQRTQTTTGEPPLPTIELKGLYVNTNRSGGFYLGSQRIN